MIIQTLTRTHRLKALQAIGTETPLARSHFAPSPRIRIQHSPRTTTTISRTISTTTSARSDDNGNMARGPPPSGSSSSSSSVKLTPTMKEIIKSDILPPPQPSPTLLNAYFRDLERSAKEHDVPEAGWLALATAVLMTLNATPSVIQLYQYVSRNDKKDTEEGSEAAARRVEIMREVGLKTISFNGIPKSINTLNEFSKSWEPKVKEKLSKETQRSLTPSNLSETLKSGQSLWNSIYSTVSSKLLSSLHSNHPDMDTYIIQAHYSLLLSTSRLPTSHPYFTSVPNRILTSLVAVSCLWTQGGAGPQVISHVLGLRKASKEKGDGWEGGRVWLCGEEGSEWVLRETEKLARAVVGERLHWKGGVEKSKL